MRKASTSEVGRSGAVRCAIYTRKSTEEGLEQEYNSLDAQYDACSAYIKSQRHEGWSMSRDRYDDGGFSGGTLERPALKQLLADVAAGRVQIIVLYKIDRLTRSLSDFAKIVEILDAAGASFVSVTQSFNTTTSMGRLTLNMLLSFAQFEREVTAERIRDKIAASKAKGMWMGGPLALGYRVEERKLVIIPQEAENVRQIFQRYLRIGHLRLLADDLTQAGIMTKRQQMADGSMRGGIAFTPGGLLHLLHNRIYRGDIMHKGTAFPGEHDAIVDEQLWGAVQALIAANGMDHRAAKNVRDPSLLSALIVDGHDRKMSPSHTIKTVPSPTGKAAKRYRYYITHASALTPRQPAWRISAQDVETAVVERIRLLLIDTTAIQALGDDSASALIAAPETARGIADRLSSSAVRREVIRKIVTQVKLASGKMIEILVDRAALGQLLDLPTTNDVQPPIMLAMTITKVRIGKEMKLVLGDKSGRDHALVALINEAQAARKSVMDQPDLTIKDIAAASGQCRHRFAKLVKLSWLAPAITTAILKGDQPSSLTAKSLLLIDLPMNWDDQKRLLKVA